MRRLEVRDLVESPALYPTASMWFASVLAIFAYSTGRVSIWECITGLVAAGLVIVLAFVVRELNDVHTDVEHLSDVLEENGLPVPPTSRPQLKRRR